MQEIKSSEVNETKAPEVENYRNIQPENGMTVSEAKDFWNKEFTVEPIENTDSEFGGKYNSYEKRLGCVPADGETGKFEGERGNSKSLVVLGSSLYKNLMQFKKNLLNMERMVSSIRILNLIFLRFRREQ